MRPDASGRGRALLLAALVIGAAAPARAERVDATATTLIAGRQDPRDGKVYTVVPAYQQLTLSLSDVQSKWVDDFKVVVSAWGQIAYGDLPGVSGDVDALFVEGRLLKRHLHLRVGRQLLVGGAFRNIQIDGAAVTVNVVKGLYVTGVGGAPVTPRFGVARGDAMGGVRAAYRFRWDTELGLSFIHVMDKGRIARQEAAADLRFVPHPMVNVQGFAAMSTVDSRLSEADLQVNVHPHRMVDVTVDWRRTAPDLFIPRSSIFSVFSQETRDEAGGGLYIHPHPRLRIYANSHFISAESGYGQRTIGKVTLSLGPSYEALLGAEVRYFTLPYDNGFQQFRVFGTLRPIPRMLLTLDCDSYWLDKPVNGQTFSFTGAATVGFELGRGFRALASFVGDTTPLVERRFEGMFKLAFNETIFVREVRK